jgi:two-component system cell cycle sensor histidine kinase/response regulator CckA
MNTHANKETGKGTPGNKTETGKPQFSAARPLVSEWVITTGIKQVVPSSAKKDYAVLVVEPDAAVREVTAELINGLFGYTVKTSSSIPEAAEMCMKGGIGVVVLNIENVIDIETRSGKPSLKDRIAPLKETGIKILAAVVAMDENAEAVLLAAGADKAVEKNWSPLGMGIKELLPVHFAGEAHGKAPQTNGKTVLIMFEERMSADSLKDSLVHYGYDVVVARTYEEAVQKAGSADFIAMDEGLHQEGIDALKEIRAANPAAKVAIRPEFGTDAATIQSWAATEILPVLTGGKTLKAMLDVYLPLAGCQGKESVPAARDQKSAAPAKAAPQKKMARILAVDDDMSITEFEKTLAEMNGYECTCAWDGKDGLEAYRKAFEAGAAPDLVISDRQMPLMGGAEMVTGIRKINPSVKVIYMSAYSREEDLAELKATNPDKIVKKPASADALASAIREVLSS